MSSSSSSSDSWPHSSASRVAVLLTAALPLVVLSTGGGMGCDSGRELTVRRAVKLLAIVPAARVERAFDVVVGFGQYAIPDIEQELHALPEEGRLRLVEALRRIGHRDALPLVRHLAQRDPAAEVRRRAAQVTRALGR